MKLNEDILYLILQELQDDKRTLHSCLSFNKYWCEIIVPILWENPWKFLKSGKEKLLLRIIVSHLSDESRNKACDFLTSLHDSYDKYDKRPLFDYISFCRH